MPICSKKHPLGTQHCYECGDCMKELNLYLQTFHFKGRLEYFCSEKCRRKAMFPNKQ